MVPKSVTCKPEGSEDALIFLYVNPDLCSPEVYLKYRPVCTKVLDCVYSKVYVEFYLVLSERILSLVLL